MSMRGAGGILTFPLIVVGSKTTISSSEDVGEEPLIAQIYGESTVDLLTFANMIKNASMDKGITTVP